MRRAVGIFAACVVASLAVGAQAVPAAAPVDGALYGLAIPGMVESIEPVSGGISTVASLAGVGPNPSGFALAADVERANLDALVATCTSCPNAKGGGGTVFWQIATIGPATGSVVAGAILQRPIAQSIAVDPETHGVWGVIDCFVVACPAETVVRIDPASAQETDVATLPVQGFFAATVALAPKSHTLYVLANSVLFAVDTRSGMVSAGQSIGSGVTGMAVDASNGALFVLRGGLQQQDVERIDPSTGRSTVLATFSGMGLTSPTVDSKSHTLFAEEIVMVGTLTAFEVVSVNDRSGAVTSGKPVIQFAGPLAFLHD